MLPVEGLTVPAWQRAQVGASDKELNVPEGQGVHSDWPKPLYIPAEQEEHAELPLNGLNFPAGQGVQADEEVLPVQGLNVPAAQSVHSDDCPEPLYVPGAQRAHDGAGRPPGLKDPGWHSGHDVELGWSL